MKDRITQFLAREGISPAEFADKIGVQRSSVSHVLNGRNYPSASFIQKMLSSYKSLNPRWLLLGEGAVSEAKTDQIRLEHTLFSIPTAPEAPKLPKEPIVTETGVNPAYSLQSPDNTIDTPLSSVTPNPGNDLNLTQPMAEMMKVLSDNKEVEKIVLFFSDKTFTAYTPSK